MIFVDIGPWYALLVLRRCWRSAARFAWGAVRVRMVRFEFVRIDSINTERVTVYYAYG